MTTAAERLVSLAGTTGTAAALLLLVGSGSTAGAALVDYSGLPTGTASEHLLTDRVSSKFGGDDAFHHTGWNKKAWKKKHKQEEALEQTIRQTYLKTLGIEPEAEEVEEVKQAVKEAAPESIKPAQFDYSGVAEWLHVQEQIVAQILREREEEDEETLLMLL